MLPLIALCACGGADTGRPQSDRLSAQTDPCLAATDLTFHGIEDFERGRAVQWWVQNDGTLGSAMEPAPGTESPAAAEIAGGRCGASLWGLHITARELSLWGGSLGYYFAGGPIDASEWDGISVWVRRGAADSGRSLTVLVSDQHTDEVHGAALFADGAPFCMDDAAALPERCDRFAAGVGLEDSWTLRTIPFTSLRQRGSGKPAPRLDREGLLGVEISFATGQWDIWLDDIGFYKVTAGAP